MLEHTGVSPWDLARWYDQEASDFRKVPLYIRTHFDSSLYNPPYERRTLYLSPEYYLRKRGLKTWVFPDKSLILVDKSPETLANFRRLTESSDNNYVYVGLVTGSWGELRGFPSTIAAYFDSYYPAVGFAVGSHGQNFSGYDCRIYRDVAEDLAAIVHERDVTIHDLDRSWQFSLVQVLADNLSGRIKTCPYNGPYKLRWNTSTVDYSGGSTVLINRQPPKNPRPLE